MESEIKNLISTLVFIVIGLSLTPVIATFTANSQANLTGNVSGVIQNYGTSSVIVGLIPLFYVIGIIAVAVIMLVIKPFDK